MPVLALSQISNDSLGLGSIVDPNSDQSPCPVAQVWLKNPLDPEAAFGELASDLVCWSGWFGESIVSKDPLHQGLVGPDVRTWTAPGWEGFERVAAQLDEAAEKAGVNVILRPHARHVLADPQSTLAWLKRTTPKRLKVLLDPAAWLTQGMLGVAEDHLTRAFESFTGHPAVWGTMLTGLEPVVGESCGDQELAPCPIGRGVLSLETVLGAIGGYDLESKPVVLLAEDFETQKRALDEMLTR